MFIEQHSFLLVMIFVLTSITVLIMSFVKQLTLSNRKDINYSNFDEKQVLFKSKPSIMLLIISCLVLIYGIVLLILIIPSNITRIYLTTLIPLIIVLVFVLINELTISKKSRDLSYYIDKKNLIDKVIDDKNTLIRLLGAYDKELDAIKKEWNETLNQLNELTTNKINTKYGDNIVSFERTIKELRSSLVISNSAYINTFNSSLEVYVKENKINEFDVNTIDVPEEASMNNGVKSMKEELMSVVLKTSRDIVRNKTLNNESSLVALLRLNNKAGVFYSVYLNEILDYINDFNDKEAAINFLFNDKVIHKDNVIYSINKKYSWIFIHDIYNYFKKEEFEEILLTVVSNEEIDALNNILNHSNENRIKYIKEVVSKENTTNKCVKEIFKRISAVK